MLSMFRSRRTHEALIRLAAIDQVQAAIEFGLDGTILTANQNFLDALSYTLPEIQGQHHRMFVEPAYGRAPSTGSSGRGFATGCSGPCSPCRR